MMNSNNNLEPDFTGMKFYTVENGDTLRSIAQKVFGDPEKYRGIMELNNLTNPRVYAGQTIRIPESMDSNVIIYRIRRGDTLWNISKRFLGRGERYVEIMKLNNLDSPDIGVGQRLNLPKP